MEARVAEDAPPHREPALPPASGFMVRAATRRLEPITADTFIADLAPAAPARPARPAG